MSTGNTRTMLPAAMVSARLSKPLYLTLMRRATARMVSTFKLKAGIL